MCERMIAIGRLNVDKILCMCVRVYVCVYFRFIKLYRFTDLHKLHIACGGEQEQEHREKEKKNTSTLLYIPCSLSLSHLIANNNNHIIFRNTTQ